jgi:hypothetical protein
MMEGVCCDDHRGLPRGLNKLFFVLALIPGGFQALRHVLIMCILEADLPDES